MWKIPKAGTTFVLLMLTHLGVAAAQQPDSAAVDSAARARKDSVRLQQELRRIRGEPRQRAEPSTSGATGQPLRVSRQQAIDEALSHNPTLVIYREQISQARARVTQSTALPEPSVGATVLGQTGLLHPHSGAETDLALGITIPFPNKTWLRGRVARADVDNADANYLLQRQIVTAQTAQAYDSLLAAELHRQDLLESRTLSEDFLKKTQARFDAGTAAKLDVIKARVDVAQAENDLIANERGIANARAALNRLLGRVLGASIEASDSLVVPSVPPQFEQLLQTAMARRPELIGMQRQRAGARASSQLASQFWLPDISVSVSRNNIYGEVPSYSTGIGIDLPIFFWQHRGGEVAESQHHERELAATYGDLQAQVGQDLQNAYSTATTTLRQVVFLRDELLPSARDAFRAASASYGLGGSSALEVIDARRTLVDAQSQYAAALAAVNDAVADLERAVGAPLSSVTTGDNRNDR